MLVSSRIYWKAANSDESHYRNRESCAERECGTREICVYDTKKLLDTMDMAETQYLRGWFGQFKNSEDVEKVERNLRELSHDVVTVGITAESVRLRQDQKHLREVQKQQNEELLGCKLRISKVETLLLDTIETKGSAVIEIGSEIQPQEVT